MGRRGARGARHRAVAGAGRLSTTIAPFEDSRRLTGPNLYFREPGAVLESTQPAAADAACLASWREYVAWGREQLGWPGGPACVRPHRGGAAFAFAAPVDQLFTATELNEWAWQRAIGTAVMHAPAHPAAWDADSALHTLLHSARSEARPDLIALLDAARDRGLPSLLDDDTLSLGLGCHGRSWPLGGLPAVSAVDWAARASIPTALVTGSNGKTTSVRLLAAMLRAHGLHTTHSCTDGVFCDGAPLHSGDWSGPAGARAALRHPQAEAAVLETARGGILRRGLAIDRVDAALVTNISADHFGEYGIDDLAGLAEAKLVLARALDEDGTLVLNADDAALRTAARSLTCRIAWFALDDAHPLLVAHRALGGSTCAVAAGRLRLHQGEHTHDLGKVAAMPLSAGGHARYNIANLAAAALLAIQLGVGIETIRSVLQRFGSRREDNPGRLERWSLGGVEVLLDYAHNPDGLRGLLGIARAIATAQGRLALLLGQAGNREDADIRDLAATAAQFQPELIVLKDLDGYMRGREIGEVPALLRETLREHGYRDEQLPHHSREIDAARSVLAWARAGDVLVLPVHALAARREVIALLDALQASGWAAGQPLPPAET